MPFILLTHHPSAMNHFSPGCTYSVRSSVHYCSDDYGDKWLMLWYLQPVLNFRSFYFIFPQFIFDLLYFLSTSSEPHQSDIVLS